MRKATLISAMAAIFSLSAAFAQRHPAGTGYREVHLLGGNEQNRDTVINVYDIFVDNAPNAYNIPGAPRFAFEGRERKFYLGIGGAVAATLSYDWGNPIDNAFDFTISAIPRTRRKGDGGLTQFSAATSRLFINFVAMPGQRNQLGIYLDANFTGKNYGFNLQYAYLKFRGITAGYNYSLFSDMAAARQASTTKGHVDSPRYRKECSTTAMHSTGNGAQRSV